MAEQLLHRATPTDLELRSDGRTLLGIAVPFDSPTPIEDRTGRHLEVFRRGAFAKTIAERGERVKLLTQHDHQALPIGRALQLREDPRGLVGEFRVSKTQAGDEALELVRDGALDALSIGFHPVKDDWSEDRSRVTRLEVRLREVSVVSFAAYEDARILAVRASHPALTPAAANRRLDLLDSTWKDR